jgi:mannose/cellobiose epimerase-like protein (N-acyl-D-glucosamine 2-epimerase family)
MIFRSDRDLMTNRYDRVHEWTFQHFPMAPDGEWFQRLDRQGSPIKDLIAFR